MPEQPPLLQGRHVDLRPLTAAHAAALLPSASDPEVWRWKLVPRPGTVEDLVHLIDDVMIGPGRWPFVICSRTTGRPIGSTTLANFDWRHGCVEMGFTWLERASWGQGCNEDAKLALLQHSFEELALHRVEWQVDACNERSVAALTRLGFHREGTHRSRHVRVDGTRRDSIFFSLLADEWAACRARLDALIDERAGTATEP